EYRWFVAGMLLWTLTALDTLLRPPPLPTPVWEGTTQTALNWGIPCCTPAAHRALPLRPPRLQAAVLAGPAAGGRRARPRHRPPPLRLRVLAGLAPVDDRPRRLPRLALRPRRAPHGAPPGPRLPDSRADRPGARDSRHRLPRRRHAGRWSPALSVRPGRRHARCRLVMVANLGTALVQSEELNAELEQRVADKHSELDRTYARRP